MIVCKGSPALNEFFFSFLTTLFNQISCTISDVGYAKSGGATYTGCCGSFGSNPLRSEKVASEH